MKKTNYLFSRAIAISAAALLSGAVMLNSCKKDENMLTEIKVEDTEDTEQTKQTELSEEYQYLTEVAKDSIAAEIQKLESQRNKIKDSLTILGVSSIQAAQSAATIENTKAQTDANIANTKAQSDANIANSTAQINQSITDQAASNALTREQSQARFLQDELQDLNEKDRQLALQLAKDADEIDGLLRQARVDSAQNALDISKKVLELKSFQDQQEAQLELDLQEITNDLVNSQLIGSNALKSLENAMAQIAKDSVTNSYLVEIQTLTEDGKVLAAMENLSDSELALYKTRIANEKDSLDQYYDLMASTAKKLADFNNTLAKDQETAEKTRADDYKTYYGDSTDVVYALTEKQQEFIYKVLRQTNTWMLEQAKVDNEYEVALLQQQVSLEKALLTAQEQLADWKAQEAERLGAANLIDMTELTVTLYSQNSTADKVLLSTGATITIDGKPVNAIDTGKFEGTHFMVVSAPGHLTTRFSFTIAQSTVNDKSENFQLLEKELTVYLLQSTESFTVKGIFTIDTLTDVQYASGQVYAGKDYTYLETADWGPYVTPEQQDLYTYRNIDPRYDNYEKYDGLVLTANITSSLTEKDYVNSTSGVTFTDLAVEVSAIDSKTTGDDGSFLFTGIPVLNSDFTVTINYASSYKPIAVRFWGEDLLTNKSKQKTIITDSKRTKVVPITLDYSERKGGTTLEVEDQKVVFN